jgi:hypothetical protein
MPDPLSGTQKLSAKTIHIKHLDCFFTEFDQCDTKMLPAITEFNFKEVKS